MTTEEQLQSLQEAYNNLEKKVNILIDEGNRIEEVLNKPVRITRGLTLSGGASTGDMEGFVQSPLNIEDSPNSDSSKRIAGFGIGTRGKDTDAEQTNQFLTVQKVDSRKNVFSNTIKSAQLILTLSPEDVTNFLSFFWALRSPLYTGYGTITNGASTLTDNTKEWVTNELAGAILFISKGAVTEAHIIISNTGTVITVDKPWVSATETYGYTAARPVYLGAANMPWRRLYITEDIRFGIGASAGARVIWIKYGVGTPEAAITANIGSLYLRTDGGAGTCLYIKESGAGNTGWIPK